MNDKNDHFDLIIVGTGPAGTTAAVDAAEAGLNTAVVDAGPFGGTCVLRGCNPKKVLTEASALTERASAMHGKGLSGDCIIDWGQLIAFKNKFTDPAPGKREKAFRKRGIEQFHGRARFTGENTLAVGDRELAADRILLAAGARPVTLGIEGEELLTSSDEFFDLEELPRTIVFLGGGYISFEFAHVAARAGSSVVILEASDTPLAGFDPDLAGMLIEASRSAGIKVLTGAPVRSIKKMSDKLAASSGENENQLYEADMIIHGAGRVPALEALELEQGGVSVEAGEIEINEYLQSVSNNNVYVAGDINAGSMALTPIAEIEAHAAVRNIISGNDTVPDYGPALSVVHTAPPLAAAGLSEEEARADDRDVEVIFKDTSGTKSTRRRGLTHSAIKLLVNPGSGRISGAHVLGHGAEEVINLFALAIQQETPVADLKKMPWAFPTVSSSVMWYLNRI
jgi:glutathione reductase (NADPH)